MLILVSKKTAKGDARRAEVVELIDPQYGVELSVILEQRANPILRHHVQPAAEEIELHQIQIVSIKDKARCV